jgi:IclR family transcriptional regulator, pca regulon regulatory protein
MSRQAARRMPSVDLADTSPAPDLLADAIADYRDDPDFVASLARGLAVMLSFHARRGRMTIAQISQRTGIPRAAVRRSLRTLATLGFAAADDSGRFYLRPRVLSISHAYLSTAPLPLLAQPVLNRLGESLNEACSLAILDEGEIVYLARSASSRSMSPALNVGRRLPAYCTSIGQVMLAHLPPAELDDYLKRVRLHRYTEQTVTSPRQLLALLRKVRAAGHAVASQQMESRLCTLAVPVRDTSGQFVAGMNVILGRPMAERDMVTRFLQPLQSAAAELGSLLLP